MNANEDQYVIFMSDGEPFVYNRLCITYPENDNEQNLYTAFMTGDESYPGDAEYPSMKTFLSNPSQYPSSVYYHPDGDHWIAQAIKAPEGQDAGLPNLDYYDEFRTGLGAEVYTIGYSRDAHGGLATDILQRIASKRDNFYYSESNLQEAYDQILNSIIYAANEAVVTDKMGEYFNLQILPSYTIKNGQSTITLDPAPYIEIGSWKLNSDGSRSEEYKITGFQEKPQMYKDVFELTVMDGIMNIKNISDKDIDGVIYVYYKNTRDGGLFGGITYRVPFDSLKSGELKQMSSKNLSKENSVMEFITYEH